MFATSASSSDMDAAGLMDGCRVLGRLGQGGFGTVYEVLCQDGQTYALKVVQHGPSKTRMSMAKLEGHYSWLLSHENLVKVHEVDINKEQGETRILMENCQGGDLRELMSMHQEAGSRLPLDQVWSYFIQIAKALYYLHSPDQRTDGVRGAFGHADIKPENMLLNAEQDVIKLGDLGLMSRYLSVKRTYSRAGTPAYMAPEVWRKGPSDYRAGWESEIELLQRHEFGFSHDDPDYARDADLACLIEDLMRPDPEERMTMQELFQESAFRKRMSLYELAARDRELAKLREEVAALSATNQLKAQKIEAQALVIGSLKRRLGAQKLAIVTPHLEHSQRSSATVSAFASRSDSNENETSAIAIDDTTSVKRTPSVLSCESSGATFDTTWSWSGSCDFKYSNDISVCCSIRLSLFNQGYSSWSRRVQGELPMEIPLSTFSNHNSREQSHNDVSSSSSEHSCDYRPPSWMPLEDGTAFRNDVGNHRRPRYKWRARVRTPAFQRRRLLEAFLRQQFAA